eukprot:scaffold58946_cov63-Phaeocystis_antarctica.AAC.7
MKQHRRLLHRWHHPSRPSPLQRYIGSRLRIVRRLQGYRAERVLHCRSLRAQPPPPKLAVPACHTTRFSEGRRHTSNILYLSMDRATQSSHAWSVKLR